MRLLKPAGERGAGQQGDREDSLQRASKLEGEPSELGKIGKVGGIKSEICD